MTDDDLVHWLAPKGRRLRRIGTTETTGEMSDLLQAVIDVGLAEAGVVDVRPKH